MSEMTEQSGNLLERGASIVRSLNLTNVLILAMLVVVAVPSYFAYRSAEQRRRQAIIDDLKLIFGCNKPMKRVN